MSVFLGVDGGGTKTNVVVVKEGKVLGEGSSGCTNWNNVGHEASFDNLKEAIESALAKASIAKDQVAGICLGMAGVDRPDDKDTLRGNVTKIFENAQLEIRISNDAEIAVASGTEGKLQGICVISGTGTIGMGWNEGKVSRVAGWGPLLGDQGSGFDIGLCGLRAVAAAEDRGVDSALKEAILKELGLEKAQNLIPWAYSGEKTEWAKIAALSRVVSTLAVNGDEESIEIIESSSQKLHDNFEVLYKKAGFSGKVDVVLAGGNFEHISGDNSLTAKLSAKILAKHPEANIVLPSMSAAFAAALLILNDHQ